MLSTFGIGMIALGKGAKDSFLQGYEAKAEASPYAALFANVKDFGAKGDGKSDDTFAIQKAINRSLDKSVFFPSGTYLISSSIVVPLYISLLGEGNKSRIKSTAAVPMFILSSINQYGNRYGVIRDLCIDGDHKATSGIELNNVVVGRSFYDLQINNINGTALQLDATQNCNFQSLHIEVAQMGIALLNGAGNNLFTRIEIEKISRFGLIMDVDPSIKGYNNNGFNNSATNNSFLKAVIERGNAQYGIKINYGNKNVFRDCDITLGAEGGESIVKIEKDGNLNYFENCNFPGALGGHPAVIQKGYKNYLKNCCFESYKKGTEVIQVYNKTIVEFPHFGDPSYKIVNKEGNAKYNLAIRSE
ncbi:glycosyl hydrolase family 28-related protein [Paenibacillus validus]|uniref:right-handed parallel beta-helix repeat-containing protein n=1 Tax=Paenibacillus validus TaxID=44253 RepID=UPI003D2741E7